MDSSWDPDWDHVTIQLSTLRSTGSERHPALRNRTKSAPVLMNLLPPELRPSPRFESSLSGHQLSEMRRINSGNFLDLDTTLPHLLDRSQGQGIALEL